MQYNRLNLLEKVADTKNNLVNYRHLADGTKLSAQDMNANGFAYLGSFVYRLTNGVSTLESAAFEAGRFAVAQNTNNGGRIIEPLYHYKDHLGSIRVVADAAGRVKERNDYYPFGERWEIGTQEVSDNVWRFNGKELQVTGQLNLLDYGARMYDSRTGQWTSMDPLAEKYYPVAPYTYCVGNPIRFVDPDGAIIQTHDYVDDQMITLQWRQHEDKWGFYDNRNMAYAGNNEFIGQLSNALSGLMNGGSEGYELVSGLANHSNILNIWKLDSSKAIGNDLGWNPTGIKGDGSLEQVPTTAGMSSDPMITLGHELGHVAFNWSGQQSTTWFNMTVADKEGNPAQRSISTSEIYTTHIENKIRSENNLPLRTHYGILNGHGYGPSIINQSMGVSRYYNSIGGTNFRALKRGMAPYKY